MKSLLLKINPDTFLQHEAGKSTILMVVMLSMAGLIICVVLASLVELIAPGSVAFFQVFLSSLVTSVLWSAIQHRQASKKAEEDELKQSVADTYLAETSVQLKKTHEQVSEYASILNGQIDGISEITEEASIDLMNALYEIETTIQDGLDKVELSQKSTAEFRKSSSDELERVNDRLEEITQLINNQREQDKAHNEAIQDVLQEIDNLKELTELVKNIAFQTNLLALNAAIEAARAGEYGRGFAVVAEQVRTLSSQSSEAAEKIETGIKSALQSAKVHGERLLATNHSEDTCELLCSFSDSLSNVTEHYRKLEAFSPRMLASFSGVATTIAKMVGNAIGKIQFQDIIRQRAENVKLEHDTMVSLFRHFSDYIDKRKAFDDTFNLSIAEMFENYVMEDQRRIHFDLTTTNGEKRPTDELREPKIELF